MWHDTLKSQNRAPTHEECAKERCMWVEFFCVDCVEWERGCAPAGKPKVTPQNRYVLNHFVRSQETGIDMFGLPSIHLPRWIGVRLDCLLDEIARCKRLAAERLKDKEAP